MDNNPFSVFKKRELQLLHLAIDNHKSELEECISNYPDDTDLKYWKSDVVMLEDFISFINKAFAQ